MIRKNGGREGPFAYLKGTLPGGVLNVILGGGEQMPGNVVSELEVLECDLGGDGG